MIQDRDEDVCGVIDETPTSVSQFATHHDIPPVADPGSEQAMRVTRRSLIAGVGAALVMGCFATTKRSGEASRVSGRIAAATRGFAAAPANAELASWSRPIEPPTIPWPERPRGAPTGSAFAEQIRKLEGIERDEAVFAAFHEGNVPNFLRRFVPVLLTGETARGDETAIIYVLPDYLAIGTDENFFRIPMMPATAQRIADALGCVLPTRRIVDLVYASAETKLDPLPLDAGPEMMSTDAFEHHNELIEKQRRASGGVLGGLTAGHKKDLVITTRLAKRRNRVAIYGMHRHGTPIQSLSTLHRAIYVDYAHGVRLVADQMLVAGVPSRVSEVLTDADRAKLLSDEGVFEFARYPSKRRAG